MSIFYHTGLAYSAYVLWTMLFTQLISVYRKFVLVDFPTTYGQGSFALITGPTSGIGLEFAHVCCEKGLNVVLVGRDGSKLEALRTDLLSLHPSRQVVVIQKDFKNAMSVGFHRDLADRTKDIDVSIVINNAGMAYSDSVQSDIFLEKKDPAQLIEMMYVNMLSFTLNHFYFYPRFQKRTASSAFIDLSSISAIYAMAVSNVYGCTKAFNRYLTSSLAYSNTDPRIQYACYVCGPVDTRMMREVCKAINSGTEINITPRAAVVSILGCLGIITDTCAHLLHAAFAFGFEFLAMFERTKVADLFNFLMRRFMV